MDEVEGVVVAVATGDELQTDELQNYAFLSCKIFNNVFFR